MTENYNYNYNILEIEEVTSCFIKQIKPYPSVGNVEK